MMPEGWKLEVLSDVVNVIDCKHRTPKYVDSGIPLVSPGTIKWGALDLISPVKRVSKNEYESLMDHCKVDMGDLVMSRNQSLGIASYVESKEPFVLGQDTVLIKPINANIKFIFYKLQSDAVQKNIIKLAGGSTFSRINLADIRKLKVTLPPISQQKKIAKILSTWDKAITTTEQLLTNSQRQKKALMQQLLTGKKRLLDENGVRFRGEWKFTTFDEIFQVANKKTAQVKSSSYLESGAVPIVDQGKKLVAGYCNNEITFNDVPVIVFGDHTRCVKWISFEFCPGADGTQVLKAKPQLDIKFAYYLLSNTDIPNLGYSRHMRELKEKDFKIPVEIEEQVAIAKSLTVAEQEYWSLTQKMNCLKVEKKALMQQLLTGKRRVKVDEEAA